MHSFFRARVFEWLQRVNRKVKLSKNGYFNINNAYNAAVYTITAEVRI